MFFTLSKALVFFCMPSNLLAGLALAGAGLFILGWPRPGGAAMVIAAVLIAALGWSPIATALLRMLEDRFPAFVDDGRPIAGIIVLGGSFDTLTSGARGMVSLNEAGERLTEAVSLANRYPEARVVFTGGDWTMFGEGPTEASLARRFFPEMGLDPSRVLYEGQARTTAENASRLRDLLEGAADGRWLLVTSGYHMPRAVGSFRAAGFSVAAYPVDYRTRGSEDLWYPQRTVSDGLSKLDIAAREWIGLLAYWVSGRSSALYPHP
jgi:uncharacterized SAM-binding protein YcdF (DUF218 family)